MAKVSIFSPGGFHQAEIDVDDSLAPNITKNLSGKWVPLQKGGIGYKLFETAFWRPHHNIRLWMMAGTILTLE